MATRTWSVVLIALALLGPAMAGCIGNDGEDDSAGNTSAQTGNQTGQAPTFDPIEKNWTDSTPANAPYTGSPAMSTAQLVKDSLDNGANGTYVLGYNLNVPEGASELTVTLSADEVDPQGVVQDYDLYVYDPDGGVVGQSTNEGTDETVSVSNPATGTYLIGVLHWSGADAEGSVAPVVIGATIT